MDSNRLDDGVGKRMPYRVPEGFFPEMEDRLMAQAMAVRDRRRFVRVAAWIGAAAAVAAVVVALPTLTAPDPAPDFAEVAQAFEELSEQDQEYMLDIYQDDIFIDEY